MRTPRRRFVGVWKGFGKGASWSAGDVGVESSDPVRHGVGVRGLEAVDREVSIDDAIIGTVVEPDPEIGVSLEVAVEQALLEVVLDAEAHVHELAVFLDVEGVDRIVVAAMLEGPQLGAEDLSEVIAGLPHELDVSVLEDASGRVVGVASTVAVDAVVPGVLGAGVDGVVFVVAVAFGFGVPVAISVFDHFVVTTIGAATIVGRAAVGVISPIFRATIFSAAVRRVVGVVTAVRAVVLGAAIRLVGRALAGATIIGSAVGLVARRSFRKRGATVLIAAGRTPEGAVVVAHVGQGAGGGAGDEGGEGDDAGHVVSGAS